MEDFKNLQIAQQLGYKACSNGELCMPSQDSKFETLIKNQTKEIRNTLARAYIHSYNITQRCL